MGNVPLKRSGHLSSHAEGEGVAKARCGRNEAGKGGRLVQEARYGGENVDAGQSRGPSTPALKWIAARKDVRSEV